MQDELHRSTKSSTVIGLLDIYGFEVLQHNRYKLDLFSCLPQFYFRSLWGNAKIV